MSIVTVSHEIGAGGPEIGQKVAETAGPVTTWTRS